MSSTHLPALWGVLLALLALTPLTTLAQDTSNDGGSQLILSTPYPAQSVEAGESVTLGLKVRAQGLPAQAVRLQVAEGPDGWSPTFLGNGRAVQAVYVTPESPASVDLRLEPPSDVATGQSYSFRIMAQGQTSNVTAELPLTMTVQEQLPPQLSLNVELPTLRGSPGGTITFQGTLANEGDQDLTVELSSDAPENFEVTFKSRFGGQEVTSLPVAAGESEELDIEVAVPEGIQAQEYQIGVQATAGDVQQTQLLNAIVEGSPSLSVSAPDNRPVSAQATIGQQTSIDFVVRNTGTAAAEDVQLSASSPSEWTTEFQPSSIGTIPPGEQASASALVTPSEGTFAGDYFLTITARTDGNSASTEFRITAQKSTIWGVVGIALIAVALGAVGLAVVRYGRR